jgi:group I intron endonuclease
VESLLFFFFNIKEEKNNIYKELRNKSGVYMLINNKTKDFYIGSSLNLTKRMVSYYYYTNSDKLSKIVIIRAMKKYGLDNFSLGILEFCKKDTKICLDLEQKALDKYKPKYNVLKIAGNSFGFKHKIETIIKLKLIFNKENHPKFGTVASFPSVPTLRLGPGSAQAKDETKKAISEGIKNFYLTSSHPAKGLKGKLSAQYGIGGKSVFCYSKTGTELIFPSINATRQHFKVR